MLLAPDVAPTQTALGNSVTAAQAVTQNSQAVLTLIPAYYPALENAPALQSQLAGVVSDASTWPNALCGQFTQTIPQQFIDEDALFSSMTATILAAQQQLAANPADSVARAQLEQSMQTLVNASSANTQALQGLQQQLIAYQTTLQNDHTAIAGTLDQLANQIPGGGTVVRSVAATLSVDFLDCQQLGPCLAVVQIKSEVQVQLTTAMNVAPQIVPVALMRALLERLLTTNESATQAMSRILDTWSVLAAKQAAFLDDLRRASNPHLPILIQQLDVQQARTAWNQLAAYARNMTR